MTPPKIEDEDSIMLRFFLGFLGKKIKVERISYYK